ncbi:uncharacterized protein LOC129743324 [Uranotaenia lowii]|uniref:uncharacterized protein LOC129743324 n=1 Tax=Uranotaenia lowii TaxID=190385 RepID=UPI0024786E74|nr:uncharacterized protein LOC129743324 [Uranotaenia lowii]
MKEEKITSSSVCDSWVQNLTNEDLPDCVMRSLQLGSGFNCPDPHAVPYVMILSEIESVIQYHTQAQTIRFDISNAVTNHINYTNQSFHDDYEWIRKEMNDARKFLKDRPDLIVTKADKGKQIVVMKTEDYKSKINDLVNDSETYIELPKDPTAKTLKRINALIDNWVSNKYIEQPVGRKLKLFHCNPPRAYGLPKTHKEGVPLRLIVSTIGTATYRMAKFLASILNGIVGKSKYHVNNSFQFAEEVREIAPPLETVLFSLDVVSLFTNVPVDFAIESVDLRWTEVAEHTDIEKESFIEMLKIVLESNFFQLNGKIFAQKFGVPMGSPLSPVIASIALERIENAALDTLLEQGIAPVLYKRYVDDCLVCAKVNEQQPIMEVFNSMHQRLKFTIEHETDGRIKFLDMIVRREQQSFTTEWFPKDEKGRYLDFGSASWHNLQEKLAASSLKFWD